MKTVRLTIGIVAIAVLLLVGSAFAQDVKVDYDHSFDFGTLKSFSMKIATSWDNPISEQRVLDTFEAALVQKGWTKTEEATADATVLLHGATQQKRDLSTFYTGGYSGWGYRGWGGGMSTAHTTVNEYKVGTLVVDIFDTKNEKLVFRGIAQDELSDKPEKNTQKIQKSADKMFKDFPPGSKK